MKIVSVEKANNSIFNVFTSSKNRSLYCVDFKTMDPLQKAEYVKGFFGKEVWHHQVDPVDKITDPFVRWLTYNASRQVGKCLEGNSLITLGDGNVCEISSLPKEALVDVATMYRGRITKAKAVLIESGVKPVFQHEYYAAPSVTCSDDHRLYRRITKRAWKDSPVTYHGNDYVRSADQQPRDHIATAWNLTALQHEPQEDPLRDEQLELLAFHLAEGTCATYAVGFTNSNPAVVARYRAAAATLGDTLRTPPSSKKAKDSGFPMDHYLCGGNFLQMLRTWGVYGKDCYTKTIPPVVFSCGQRQIRLFLNRLFACDGYAAAGVDNKSAEIGISLANRTMIFQIANLLRMLGFPVSVRTNQRPCCYPDGTKKYFTHWSACIAASSRFVRKFRDEIGMLSKEAGLDLCVAIADRKKISPRFEHSFEGDLQYAFYQGREYAGEQKCYDLSIIIPPVEAQQSTDYEPNFIANGFVVHNSEVMSWSEVLLAMHNLYPALDNVTKVVHAANKNSQALIVGNRIRVMLENIYERSQFFWDREGSNKQHLVFKRESGITSRQVGTIDFVTANPKAFGEGLTASVIMIDEAGRMDNRIFSEVIIPYGGSTFAKLLMTGVPRGRNCFYDACNSKDYAHLHYPWDKVETYRKAAPCDLLNPITNELILETGTYPLEIMPLTLKKALFPMNPLCHMLPNAKQKEKFVPLWDLSGGIMSEEDFRTQYMLEWLAAVMAILQLQDQLLLFEQSDHAPLQHGEGEEYYFGLDCGGAQNAYASGTHDKDKAALSVWCRRGGVKHKVFCDELFSAQPDELVAWLLERVSPHYGWFPCKWGGVDVTGAVGAFASEKLVQSRLPVVPIIYNRTEPTTHKNMKNAMFDYFKIENAAGRCRYPAQKVTDELDETTLQPKNPTWYNARHEWEVIEGSETGGVNRKINSPYGEHDDHPNADVLAVFVMDRGEQQFGEFTQQHRERPKPILSGGLQGGTRLQAIKQFRAGGMGGSPFGR